MFEENLDIYDGETSHHLDLRLGLSGPFHKVFRFWAAELARDMLRLGVYFHAVGFFLQIPGATEFEWLDDDHFEEEQGLNRGMMLTRSRRDTLLTVLADCLERLDAESLLEQLPEPMLRDALPEEWTRLIERRAKIENGLLTLVAECLDAAIVEPGMDEIAKADLPHWWNRFRVKLDGVDNED